MAKKGKDGKGAHGGPGTTVKPLGGGGTTLKPKALGGGGGGGTTIKIKQEVVTGGPGTTIKVTGSQKVARIKLMSDGQGSVVMTLFDS